MSVQRAIPRDLLTGEPLRTDTLKLRMPVDEREDNPPTKRQRAQGWRPDLTARPLRLHTQEVEEGGLGGHVYSHDMARYLASGLAQQRSERRANDLVWHRSAYGRGRVHAAFTAKFGAERGRLAYLAALAYATGDSEPEALQRETGHSLTWVKRMADLARTFAGAATH